MAERDPLIARWPQNDIPVRHVLPKKQRPSVDGPPPLAGAAQTVSSPSGNWRLIYTGVLARDYNILAVRALMAKIEGRRQPIYVGPYDYAYCPVKRAGATSPILSMWDDGTIFSDGTRWETSIYDCVLAADAAGGATEISLTNSVLAPLAAGDYFELAGRLHVLEELDGATARIWPQLRTSYSSGQKIEIDDPRMIAYLDGAADNQMQYGRWGETTLEFVEAPW